MNSILTTEEGEATCIIPSVMVLDVEPCEAVLILSGGIDSTTLLWKLLRDEFAIQTITFNYGQRHSKEIEHSKKVVEYAQRTWGYVIPHRVVDISSLRDLLGYSALTTSEIDVPHGHYTSESQRLTVVPNRNMIMLSIAAAYAITKSIRYVYYAAHASDYSVYPDCRPEFVKALDTALYLGNLWTPVELRAPFINMTKTDIVRLGLELGVPYQLTWSCYEGGDRPCLRCGTCVERTEAFAKNNTRDPLLTEEEWKKALEILESYVSE